MTDSFVPGQQLALSGGLAQYILDAPRTDLISANKEGIVSVLGQFRLSLSHTKLILLQAISPYMSLVWQWERSSSHLRLRTSGVVFAH